jgi:hypothetical protein
MEKYHKRPFDKVMGASLVFDLPNLGVLDSPTRSLSHVFSNQNLRKDDQISLLGLLRR